MKRIKFTQSLQNTIPDEHCKVWWYLRANILAKDRSLEHKAFRNLTLRQKMAMRIN